MKLFLEIYSNFQENKEDEAFFNITNKEKKSLYNGIGSLDDVLFDIKNILS